MKITRETSDTSLMNICEDIKKKSRKGILIKFRADDFPDV